MTEFEKKIKVLWVTIIKTKRLEGITLVIRNLLLNNFQYNLLQLLMFLQFLILLKKKAAENVKTLKYFTYDLVKDSTSNTTNASCHQLPLYAYQLNTGMAHDDDW